MSSLLLFNCEAFVNVVSRHLYVQDFHDKSFYHNLLLRPTDIYVLSELILAAMLSNQGFRVDVDQPMGGCLDATLGEISIRTMLEEDQLEAIMYHCEELIRLYIHGHPKEADLIAAKLDEHRSELCDTTVTLTVDPEHAKFASRWVDAWLESMPLDENVNVYDADMPIDPTTGKVKLS